MHCAIKLTCFLVLATMTIPLALPAPFTTPTCRRPRGFAKRGNLINSLQAAHSATEPALVGAQGSPTVVIVGGTGRIGSNTADALLAKLPAATVSLACRSQQSFSEAVAQRPGLSRAKHVECDIDNPSTLSRALRGADLVRILQHGLFSICMCLVARAKISVASVQRAVNS